MANERQHPILGSVFPPSQEPYTQFGRLLKYLRLNRGLNQSELARLAGLDNAHISRLESSSSKPGNHRIPSYESVERLSEALGCDQAEQDELFMAAGLMPPGNRFSLVASEPSLVEIAEILAHPDIPDTYKQNIRQTLRHLIDNAWIVANNGAE